MSNLKLRSHDIVLDRATWRVRVGDELVAPEPKVFSLLGYLMSHPGRIVTKTELLDAIWAGEVVGESVLCRCVSYTRKLLSDPMREPRFIRTVHGRGYEFIAPVQEELGPARTSPDESTRPITSVAFPRVPLEGRFVGRAAELATLQSIFAEPSSDRARLVVVSGEAGVGKSRLLEEATRAPIPTAEVHRARSPSSEGSPPFFLWRQCFRSIVRERSLKAVHRVMRGSAESARKIVLGPDSGGPGDPIECDSPRARFRVFDGIAEGLTRLARQRGMVLVLDDIHLADRASLLLLAFVVDQVAGPLLILAAMGETHGSGDSARGALCHLRKTCRAEIFLRGLSPNQVAGPKP